MNSPLIEKYGTEKRWVNWKLVPLEKGKTTKVPYKSKTVKAKSNDPSTWNTYETVSTAADNGSNNFSGVGIVLHDGKLICIDIDHVVEDGKVKHAQADVILALLKKANTFTEISQSGTGLHIFLECTTPFVPLANKKAPFEVYADVRFIATTNNPFNKAIPVRTVDEAEMLQILSIIGYPWGKGDQSTSNEAEKADISNDQAPLQDDDLVERMFASKNGTEIKTVYNGDITGHENDASKADMSLLSHLAFWTRKDPVQMERIWANSPLGNRKKTKERADYRARSIRNAIDRCKSVYTISEQQKAKFQAGELDLLFVTNEKGVKVYTQNTENMARILRKHEAFNGGFRYDAFRNLMEIRDGGVWRNFTDSDSITVQTKISILFPFFGKVGKDMVYDAITLVSRENIYDSAIEYVTAIKWDGVKRLDQWLTKTYQVPDDIYHQKVGSNWMKGLVKRIVEPGCKFDYVLVLEGEQGTKKSTSLGVLGQIAPNYNIHVETTMSTDSKDFFMQFQGKAIIEFSEGETLSRTEVKRMKAIITTQVDKYRPAYGRTSEDFPRRCVFAMTTNQSEYLKDETGNRRWLPVACIGNANIEWLQNNKEQLFAEAYHRISVDKETTYEFPEEETKKAQLSRKVGDPNTDLVVDWYVTKCGMDHKRDGVTVQDVFSGAFLGNFTSNSKGLERGREMSISSILQDVLQLTKKRVMKNGVYQYKYFDENNRFVVPTDIDVLLGVQLPSVEEMRGDNN